MTRTCAVRLLGGFGVEVDGRPVPADAWRHRRGADLVKLLALSPGHRLHRDQVMEYLWPDLGAESAAANLRKAIHFARRALGDRHSIEVEGEMVALWPAGSLHIDAEGFERELGRALSRESGYESALRSYTGDLLPEDRYAAWSEPHRVRLQQSHLRLLRAMGKWQEVLDVDRADEVACRALMRSHLDAGNRHAAVREFQRLREVLRVDLGVGPEQETVRLFEEAIAGAGADVPSPLHRAQALIARGLMHWSRMELDQAQSVAEQARRLAIDSRLGRELGEASWLVGMVAFARGQWPDCFRQTFSEALQLRTDQAPYVIDAQLCLGEASLAGAHSEAVAKVAQELMPAAIEARSLEGEALLSLLIGSSELIAGRLDDSREWLSRSADLFEQQKSTSGQAFALLRLAAIATAEKRRGEAVALLRAARALADRSELDSHLVVRVLAAALEATDDVERQQLVAEAEEVLRTKLVCGPCSIGLRVIAAISCARLRELARARFFLAEAERLAAMWQGSPWQAAVWEARAALRMAEGDEAQATALLREAAQIFAECGRTLDETRCRMAMA
jgi:DNA-binding SARP family transcriptional activator